MKLDRFAAVSAIILGVLFMIAPLCLAAPNAMNFQGRLADSSGAAVPDGNYDMRFLIFEVETGGSGSQLWEEYQEVAVTDGVYNVTLGQGTPVVGSFDAALFSGDDRWLEVWVEGEALSPRQKLASVAYALEADTVDGVHAADLEESSEIVTAIASHAGDSSAHHAKTTSFSELTDSASDAQIPDNITIDYASNADKVDGIHAADLEESSEIVSAIASHAGDSSAHHAKTTSFAELTDSASDAQIPDNITINYASNADTVDNQHASAFATKSEISTLQDTVATLQNTVTALQTTIETLNSDIESLQTENTVLKDKLKHVAVVGTEMYIEGANLHVRSGSGTTDGAVNGLGNVIIGYDEARTFYSCSLGWQFTNQASCEENDGQWWMSNKTGSHNLVIGKDNNYSSFGGIVAGRLNTISNEYASVSAGEYNIASGFLSSVSGGINNTASGTASSVSGGDFNTARSERASVSGGRHNTASGIHSSVSGGSYNTASGERASVIGGYHNNASGKSATVSGGSDNAASGYASSVSGNDNEAAGLLSSVSGGTNLTETADYGYRSPCCGDSKTIVVSPVGTAEENGAALLAALDGIADNTPSNWYLIKIKPGTYDIGSTPLAMKRYVDIEGAGQSTTVIQGQCESAANDTGLVLGNSFSEMRHITLKNECPASSTYQCRVVYNDFGDDPSFVHVTMEAANGSRTYGIYSDEECDPLLSDVKIKVRGAADSNHGLCNSNADPRLKDVDIDIVGYGADNYGIKSENGSKVDVNNLTVNIIANMNYSYGIFNSSASTLAMRESVIDAGDYGYAVLNDGNPASPGGNVYIDRSTISGNNASVDNRNASASFFVGASKLDGHAGSNLTCAGAYDESNNPLNGTCQ